MKHLKTLRSLFLALASLGAAACGADSPIAPKFAADASPALATDLVGSLIKKNALTRRVALTGDITVSALIGKGGGALRIPAAGLEVIIPAGAVKASTRFTVTALKGTLVAYEFGPHGITFNVPLQARQDLSGTIWRPTSLQPLVAGYFLETAHLDQRNATALVAEVIAGETSVLTKKFNWQIKHFSGYVVAW